MGNRLQTEKQAWVAIRKPPPEQPPLFTEAEIDHIVLPDFDLLDSEDSSIRNYLANNAPTFASVRTDVEERLRRIQASLEFRVDQLADNIHKLGQRVSIAGQEADKVLSLSAARLKEREQRERKSAGTTDLPMMEVLRSLSHILPEAGGA